MTCDQIERVVERQNDDPETRRNGALIERGAS
jgi:hypothetical protein